MAMGKILLSYLKIMKTKTTIKYRNKFESDVGEQLKGWQYEPCKYPYIIKVTMGEWCDKEGFRWFTMDTLEELKCYDTII